MTGAPLSFHTPAPPLVAELFWNVQLSTEAALSSLNRPPPFDATLLLNEQPLTLAPAWPMCNPPPKVPELPSNAQFVMDVCGSPAQSIAPPLPKAMLSWNWQLLMDSADSCATNNAPRTVSRKF